VLVIPGGLYKCVNIICRPDFRHNLSGGIYYVSSGNRNIELIFERFV
jgi:hypothetical protein